MDAVTVNRSKRLLEDGHGAEVDIWGVGHMITTSTAIDVSPEFKALGEHICENACTLTAAEVLKLVTPVPPNLLSCVTVAVEGPQASNIVL
jgi:hypothetical protein